MLDLIRARAEAIVLAAAIAFVVALCARTVDDDPTVAGVALMLLSLYLTISAWWLAADHAENRHQRRTGRERGE